MKILIVGLNFAPEPTGIAPYTTAAAEELTRRGHRVTVVTGYPHYPQWRVHDGYRGWRHHEQIGEVPVIRLRHLVPGAGQQLQRMLMELTFGLRAAACRWRRPDVVLTVSPALLSSALVVGRARLQATPVVTWIQDIYTLGATQTGAGETMGRLARIVESATCRLATRNIVIHPRFGAYTRTQLGVPDSRIDVVRNWTHLALCPKRSLTTRRAHGWADDELVVLHAGNMGAKQGLETVVAASKLAAERGARIRFVLLGNGNRRAALEAMGPGACLQFLDPLPDDEFAATLASADVLLVNELPGLTEMSVPSKLTTYFATGLPVLAAVDSSSVTADEVDLSGAALRITPGDPSALLDGALLLAKDPELRARLGAAGPRFADRVLSQDAALDELDAALHRAAATRSPAAATDGSSGSWSDSG